MRRSVRWLSVLATVALLLGAPLAAQQDRDEDTEADQDSTTNPFEKFEKLVEDTELREGFFDTYEKDGHLYLAIPQDRLGEEFLLNYQIARGVGSSRLFGGTMLNIFEGAVVAFEQHDDRVYLVHRPHRFMADEGTPQEQAVALTFGSSVLQSTKVEAQRPDSAVVIDIFDWLLSDMSGISSRLRSAVSTERGKPGSVSFDKDRSYLESVKAFPYNVNFRAMLTFKPGKPTSVRGVPDSRYIPISIHYAFVRLPETPMEPRLADDRLGFFMTVRKDFTNADSTFFVRYVNRWRLERGRRRGNLW